MSDQSYETIVCYSLVDLTQTNVTGTYKPNVHGDLDKWTFGRNQQRNWESMLQLIGLRAQPVYLTDPVLLPGQDLIDYKFSPIFQGTHNVWRFEFASEHAQVFGEGLCLLKDDVHQVPVNVGLDETARFDPPVFDTKLHHNVYFCAKVIHK